MCALTFCIFCVHAFCSVVRVRSGSEKGSAKKQATAGEEELRRELDAALKELKELRERKSSLERECIIYQSQLEVVHTHTY